MQLTVNNLTKSFGTKQVLHNISFTANSGTALGLLGRNGVGKSTTIRIIMNIFKADSGTVLVDNAPIDYNSIKIGYLPEERSLYTNKKIIDQIIYFGKLKGIKKTQILETADYWLTRTDMTKYRNDVLGTLSKGNQQKIQLIVALISDPDIVILDEPFSGLDPINATILKEVVSELITKNKVVIFSSHQMNYIEEFCNSICIINDGKISLSGEISQIKKSYPQDTIIINSQDTQAIQSFLQDDTTFSISNITRHDSYLTVTLQNESDKLSFMKYLISNNFDLDELRVKQPSLNDIFVQYAGGANNEQ